MAKILICDDNSNIVDLIIKQLEGFDYEIHTASEGKKGVVKANKIEFDLIITDVEMPVWSGYEFAEKIGAISDCKFLFITGFTEGELTSKIKKLPNYLGLLEKPWKIAELRKIVELHCKS